MNGEIQRLSFYSPSHGFVSSKDNGSWVGFTSDSGRTIQKRYITISNVNYNNYNVALPFIIKGVKAFNADTILAYGSYNFVPSVLYSVDGGLTYKLVYHSPVGPSTVSMIYDMLFPQNNNIGYAVDGYRILRTINKGLTWTIVHTDANSVFGGLDAIDNTNIFAFSTTLSGTGYKMVKSVNAGLSWQNIVLPSASVISADFLTTQQGWLNDNDGRIFSTTTAGASWTQKNNTEVSPFYFLKMEFMNDSTGFAIADLYQTYKTTDSGKVWEPIQRTFNYNYELFTHSDMQLINNSQLWAGGWKELIELNTNITAAPLPKAYFLIDTTNLYSTNTVQLKNFSKPTYQYKWYVNGTLLSTSYNTSYTHSPSNSVDSIKLIVISGINTDTLLNLQYYNIVNLPLITSFSPSSGSQGTEILIKGSRFTGTNSVTFGGTPAQSFNVLSDTTIRAVVNTGSSGSVRVAIPGGGYSLSHFSYFPPPSSPPPVINTVSPDFGPVGTSIILTGSNFGINPEDNIVLFGDTKATVTSASATQIVCTVPYGASFDPISLLNKTTALSGTSIKPFNVTFADSSHFTTYSFGSAHIINYENNNTQPFNIATNDLDADGKPDLVCTFYSADSISVYRNTFNGMALSFAPKKTIGTGGFSLRIADLDGDGKSEIVTTSKVHTPSTNSIIDIYKNNCLPGQLNFAQKLSKQPNALLEDIALADFDNDGRVDIVGCTQTTDSAIVVYKNTSSAGYLSFSAPFRFSTGGSGYFITVGDFDEDGKKDIIVVTRLSAQGEYLACFRNTSTQGNISFAPRTVIPLTGNVSGSGGATISTLDFDANNRLDIILASGTNRSLFRNISTPGNINFVPESLSITTSPTGGSVANISGDKKPDIFYNIDGQRTFEIKRNISVPNSTTLESAITITPPIGHESFPLKFDAADMDMDGKADILYSSNEANQKKILIYKNKVGESVTINACPGIQRLIYSGLPGTTFQWQQDAGTGFVNISNNSFFSGTQSSVLIIQNIPLAWNGYKFRCIIDASFSPVFDLVVIPTTTPSISISTPATSVCAGLPVTFTATIANGGANPTYQWLLNGNPVGTNSPIFTINVLNNNDQISCKLTSNAVCLTTTIVVSSAITMTVIGALPSVTIAGTPSSCPGNPITFTATPLNAGTGISYQWLVNGINQGTSSPSFTVGPLTPETQISVLMTFTSSCSSVITVSSNTITIPTAVTPSVTISTLNTNICSGSTAFFSSSSVNGGSTPVYQWQVNGVNVGTSSPTFSSSALTNGSQVKLLMTSSANCPSSTTVISNIITMTVNPTLTPSITISGNTTVMVGQSTTLTALAINGGAAPVLTWLDSTSTHTWQSFLAGSGLTTLYTPAATGDKVRCILTSNASCVSPTTATSNALVFTLTFPTAINPVPGTTYGIKFYPNPVTSKLFIDSLRLADKWQTLEIFDLHGKRVVYPVNIMNHVSKQIDIMHLPAGLYIALIRKKNGVTAFYKFIKL